jgi:hypothetical protein
MTRYGSFGFRNNLIFKSFLIVPLIIYSSLLYGQSPVNFSGVWTQDNAKSDDFYKSFGVVCTITQIPESITLKQTFFDENGKEVTSHDFFFTLDGKEAIKEEFGGINKELATWSPDKKILTTRSTRTVGNEVYGSTATYSLSENGLVMTVQTKDINPLGMSVKQIFNKKK